MKTSMCCYFLIAVAFMASVQGFNFQARSIRKYVHAGDNKLQARVSKAEDEQQVQQENGKNDDMMTIPYTGLIGKDNGALFDKPLDIFDPTKDTGDLPGEDGSDEKIAAIQDRIQQRVAALKAAGEWDDEVDVFGRDPLANQPIWQTMAMQIKVCKPFDSFDELALTYFLMLGTTISLMGFLITSREIFDSFIEWWVKTDFF